MTISAENHLKVMQPHRIWTKPLLVSLILAEIEPTDFRAAQRVCRDFYEILNCPPMWAQRYAPSELNIPLRQVCTHLRPKFLATDNKVYSPNTVPLGLFRGDLWLLQFHVNVPCYPTTKYDHKNLDWMAKNTFGREALPLTDSAAPIALEQTPALLQVSLEELRAQRQRAYEMILKRGYRRFHGTSVSETREIIPPVVSTFCVISVLLGLSVKCTLDGLNRAETGTDQLFLGAALVLESLYGVALLRYDLSGQESAWTTLFRVPFRFIYLNRYADHYFSQATRPRPRDELATHRR